MAGSLVAIGDLQGCLDPLRALLARLPESARLIFVGDIVNRGPQSAATLRFVRALGDRAVVLLGNHDLHLLAVAYGIQPAHRSDTLDDILQAPDRDELIDWVRARPLAWRENGALFVHAGVLPPWTAERTLELAGEVEAALRGAGCRQFLAAMYGNQPARWDDRLQGAKRARCVVNALTRLRFLDADGTMDFQEKGGAGSAPAGLMPWFEHPQRESRGTPIVFGHWSALGLLRRDNVYGLDTGCVWGGQLTALSWPDGDITQVPCPGGAPGGE